jgi:hypothetical protein
VRLRQPDPELQAVHPRAGFLNSGLVRSECTMPRPAVIQLIAPGWIGCTDPKLSRCTISPSNR